MQLSMISLCGCVFCVKFRLLLNYFFHFFEKHRQQLGWCVIFCYFFPLSDSVVVDDHGQGTFSSSRL